MKTMDPRLEELSQKIKAHFEEGPTVFACSYCRHEINEDGAQGKEIEDKNWNNYMDHGICIPCKDTVMAEIKFAKEAAAKRAKISHDMARMLRTIKDGGTRVEYLMSTGIKYGMICKAFQMGMLVMGEGGWTVSLTKAGKDAVEKESLSGLDKVPVEKRLIFG